MNYWNLYENKEINFSYEGIICNDEVYYWLGAYSEDLEKIRVELGLSNISPITQPPDRGYRFHITIGNTKST